MKHNRICAYCGRSYYVCLSCVSVGSYKNSYCSEDCFRRSVMDNKGFQPIIIEGEEMKTLLILMSLLILQAMTQSLASLTVMMGLLVLLTILDISLFLVMK